MAKFTVSLAILISAKRQYTLDANYLPFHIQQFANLSTNLVNQKKKGFDCHSQALEKWLTYE